MKFPDVRSASGQPEQYVDGTFTGRFVITLESQREFDAVRGALAAVALMAMQSEIALDPEDARMLLDFMRVDQSRQGRTIVTLEQAKRLASLVQLGSTSVTPNILDNQFNTRRQEVERDSNEDVLVRTATEAVAATKIEIEAREFRGEIDELLSGSFDRLFGPPAEES